MAVAKGRPKTVVAAKLRENKYGGRTAGKMRSAVLLYLRITVIDRRNSGRGDMRFFPISKPACLALD